MTATTRTILAVDLGKNKSVACVNDPAADFAFIEQHPIPSGGGAGGAAAWPGPGQLLSRLRRHARARRRLSRGNPQPAAQPLTAPAQADRSPIHRRMCVQPGRQDAGVDGF